MAGKATLSNQCPLVLEFGPLDIFSPLHRDCLGTADAVLEVQRCCLRPSGRHD
jgi:hypothetical protein